MNRGRHAFWVLILLLAGCDEDVFQRMKHQPKFLPYSANPLFGDDRSMRPPPEGTVPYRHLFQGPYDAARIPIPLTGPLLEKGRTSFDIYCATCHGRLGNGSSMVASKMGLRPPPSLHARPHTPGNLFEVITLGRGLMASYLNELPSPEDRWAVVGYVQALVRSQNSPLKDAPADVQRTLTGEP